MYTCAFRRVSCVWESILARIWTNRLRTIQGQCHTNFHGDASTWFNLVIFLALYLQRQWILLNRRENNKYFTIQSLQISIIQIIFPSHSLKALVRFRLLCPKTPNRCERTQMTVWGKTVVLILYGVRAMSVCYFLFQFPLFMSVGLEKIKTKLNQINFATLYVSLINQTWAGMC